jgi:hypothetical protein
MTLRRRILWLLLLIAAGLIGWFLTRRSVSISTMRAIDVQIDDSAGTCVGNPLAISLMSVALGDGSIQCAVSVSSKVHVFIDPDWFAFANLSSIKLTSAQRCYALVVPPNRHLDPLPPRIDSNTKLAPDDPPRVLRFIAAYANVPGALQFEACDSGFAGKAIEALSPGVYDLVWNVRVPYSVSETEKESGPHLADRLQECIVKARLRIK